MLADTGSTHQPLQCLISVVALLLGELLCGWDTAVWGTAGGTTGVLLVNAGCCGVMLGGALGCKCGVAAAGAMLG